MESVTIQKNLEQVRQTIRTTCERIGRDPASITLVAVSKHQPTQAIQKAYEAGQVEFGENYAQEVREKVGALLLGNQIRWHFLGPLQRNKARLVVGTAALIHSVDRMSVLEAIAEQAQKKNLVSQDCLVEVNIGHEEQKSGCRENELSQLLSGFSTFAGKVRCLGLMCIPPAVTEAERSRQEFRKLQSLLKKMQKISHAFVELRELSMGMSQDFSVAIEEGATIVRVGTAIFGSRPAPRKEKDLLIQAMEGDR